MCGPAREGRKKKRGERERGERGGRERREREREEREREEREGEERRERGPAKCTRVHDLPELPMRDSYGLGPS